MASDNLISPVPDKDLRRHLEGYPQKLVFQLREKLKKGHKGLREKFNMNSRYLGYAGGESDALYVYVQRQGLVLDVRVPEKEYTKKVEDQGFEVRPRNNYQGRAGWLTGLRVPHETKKLGPIAKLALYALKKHRLRHHD